ncbi:hypothetical protein ACQV5M_20390, partial [Leptospira sp. SA-E8]|uniref:hypothetical protein n=1 Tax=Leptospira sp. SA-E8 TaxID=3422259 RepID=UPI003EB7F391
SFFGIYRLHQSLQVFDVQVAAAHQSERLAAGMLGTFKTQVQEWKNVLLRGTDAEQLERYWGSFGKSEQEVALLGQQLMTALPAGEARRLVEQFLLEHRKMGEGYRQGLEAYKAAGFAAAAGDKAVSGMDRAPARLLDEAGQQIARDAGDLAQRASEQGRQAVIASLAMVLMVCAASAALSVWLARSLMRPIRQAVAHTE